MSAAPKVSTSAVSVTSLFGSASAASSAAALPVGARVRTEFGDTGTVRFSGKTLFRPGEWVGVELDDPCGKNDGRVHGVRYFSCSAGHGLLARRDALTLSDSDEDEDQPIGVTGAAAAVLALLARRAVRTDLARIERLRLSVVCSEARLGLAARRTVSSSRVLGRVAEEDFPTTPRPLSLWQDQHVPWGWQSVWLEDTDDSGDGVRLPAPLPVTLYVSSSASERKSQRDCRFARDFLLAKKVPHAIVDLACRPGENRALFDLCGGPSSPPARQPPQSSGIAPTHATRRAAAFVSSAGASATGRRCEQGAWH